MNDFLWVEKYRPQKVDECILPESVKNTFQSFLEQGEIPNLLLSGTAGVGKTTIAKALCHELGADYYVINGSDEGRFLDTGRNQAKNFASLCLSLLLVSTKFLSSMRQTIQRLMFNFYSVLRLRSFKRTADSSLLVTSKTRSSSRYIVGRLS